jgi:enoyl-CoA hydratase/carnithine racemase
MDQYRSLRVEVDERGVVTVTLDNPRRKNAIHAVMFQELRAVFRHITERPSYRVVVVTGAGDAFCSGADLSGTADSEEQLHTLHHLRNIGETALALSQLQQPVVAKVNGDAIGAGMNLALGCDLIYASDRARFSQIFAKRGLSVDFGGSWLLPRLVGIHKAKELALLADMLDAREAERIGVVNRVVPHDELDAYVDDVVARIAAGPPIALGMTKRLLNQAKDVTLAEAVEAEAMAQAVNGGTQDMRNAIIAFREKRTPTFEGR